ncbi:uncharacterized protein LOC135838084 [Planococcus citri]|uniref:uncharacterized protein LOC135838084 n=1 Tax=Planococcus citri TaxID=170843 RepID=UPI0031FA461C
MKMFILQVVVLYVLLINEFAGSENTPNTQNSDEEFETYISKFVPKLRQNATRMFYRRKLSQKDAIITQKDAIITQKDATIKEMDRDRFSSAACSTREQFNELWSKHVDQHAILPTNANEIEALSGTVKNPPELAENQIRCPNPVNAKFISKMYPTYLHYINKNDSNFAKQVRLNLQEAGLSHEQFAWSAPKIYKHCQVYSHESKSNAIVTFDEFDAIQKLATGEIDKIGDAKIRSDNHMKILGLMGNTSIRPEFMDFLEELNDWYLTKEDCDVIRIVMKILYLRAPIECVVMKKYPDRAVPFVKIGHSTIYEDGCVPSIGGGCEPETTSGTFLEESCDSSH